MNRNMSRLHRKEHLSLPVFSTRFDSRFPCETGHAVSSLSDRPTPPIFRYGTRPSTDRAVRALPRRYRDHKRGPRRATLISASQYRGALFSAPHFSPEAPQTRDLCASTHRSSAIWKTAIPRVLPTRQCSGWASFLAISLTSHG